MINPKPSNTEFVPLLTESAPSDGPTILSSIIFTGAGNAPALSTMAISIASSIPANPSIIVPPSLIFVLIDGAI